MSLAKRIGLLFAGLAAIIIVDNILIYRFFDQTEDYGRSMSLAARQSFLVERIELFLLLGDNSQAGVRQSLLGTIDEFDRSLSLFEHGGVVEDSAISAAPKHAAEALARERELWNELRPLLLTIQSTRDAATGQARQRAYERAAALTPGLSEATANVVDGLEAWRAELRRGFFYLGAATTLVAGFALLGALGVAWKEFVKPVERLRSEALRVREQDLPKPSGDELQEVTQLVTDMSSRVERLRSEREQVAEELRQVEADYQAIFENAAAGICQFDRAGALLLANPAMADLLGYPSDSELIRSVTNVHEELFVEPDHQRALVNAADKSVHFDLETRLRRQDGSVLWVRESGSFHEGEGGSGYFESIIIDITRRRKAEESLRELSNLLLRSQEEERRRIARELHDSTGQMLAALEINLDGLGASEENLSEELRSQLSSCGKLVAECSRTVRSMSYLLHPPMLEELGLVYALREFVDGFSRRSGIKTELQVPDDLPRVTNEMELALFRVVQEALTNVHRHAASPTAIVSLRAEAGEIRLSVRDEGKGVPPRRLGGGEDALVRMGVGIRGMAERVKQLGGQLRVESSPEGTTVEATLPLHHSVAAEG